MRTSYCWVFFNCWYHLQKTFTFYLALSLPSFSIVLLAMATWSATETSLINSVNVTKSRKCSYILLKVATTDVLELGVSKR